MAEGVEAHGVLLMVSSLGCKGMWTLPFLSEDAIGPSKIEGIFMSMFDKLSGVLGRSIPQARSFLSPLSGGDPYTVTFATVSKRDAFLKKIDSGITYGLDATSGFYVSRSVVFDRAEKAEALVQIVKHLRLARAPIIKSVPHKSAHGNFGYYVQFDAFSNEAFAKDHKIKIYEGLFSLEKGDDGRQKVILGDRKTSVWFETIFER